MYTEISDYHIFYCCLGMGCWCEIVVLCSVIGMIFVVVFGLLGRAVMGKGGGVLVFDIYEVFGKVC